MKFPCFQGSISSSISLSNWQSRERVITAVIPVEGSPVPLSVKTARPVPKSLIPAVMESLASVRISLPVHTGQVILPDVLGTGSDIVATRSLKNIP